MKIDIAKKAKDVAKSAEEKVEKGLEVAKEAITNVASHLPFVNLAKKDDKFMIEVDMPGVKKKDIDIKIEDDRLVVTAQRMFKKEVKEEDYYLCESSFGVISRVFVLPEGINRYKVEAKYDNGRLYITLEKEESRKTKQISVK